MSVTPPDKTDREQSPALPPALSGGAPEVTLEPDREARRALANTLVLGPQAGGSGAGGGLVGAIPVEEIPLVSLGHGELGEVKADLEVVSRLGAGGTGHVYLAHQRALHRDVAVKVLKDDAADLGVCLVYEARVATRVEHPNVVPVYLLGRTDGGMPVLVMKHIRGVSWHELSDSAQHPMWNELAGKRERVLAHLEIFLAVCNAVGAAHRQGIIHRDVKPANVMIAGPGEVYLMDWGIAFDRATPPPPSGPGLVGTPAFMAPEMLSGVPAELDQRTDVFMLGASLHFALTRRHRNEGASNEQAIASLRKLAPYDYGAAVPVELAAILNRATAADPNARFSSTAELREAVQTFIDHHESYRMAERAKELVDEVAGGALDDANAARRLDRVRLVLHGALEAWADNPLARAELERVRALQVEAELAAGNLAAARGTLEEMSAPAAALVDKVRAREAEDALRREREERLAAFEREMDLRTAARTRRWFFGLLAVYSVALGVVFVALRAARGEDASGLRALMFSSVTTSFFVSMVIVARREILGNRVNRAIVGLTGGFFVFNLAHRAVALVMDGSLRFTITVDVLAAGIIAALGALIVSPRLWVVPPACAAGVVVATLMPQLATASFAVCALFLIVMMLREWGRDPTRM